MRRIGRVLLSLSETPKRVWLVILTELFLLAALNVAISEVGGKIYDLGDARGDCGSRCVALWRAENVLLDVFLYVFCGIGALNAAMMVAQTIKYWTTAYWKRRNLNYLLWPVALQSLYLLSFGFISYWSPGVQMFHRWQAGVVLALLIVVAVFWRAKPTPTATKP